VFNWNWIQRETIWCNTEFAVRRFRDRKLGTISHRKSNI